MRIGRYLEIYRLQKKNFIILGSIAALVASMVFLTHLRLQKKLLGYDIAQNEALVSELEERLHQLELERAVLKRPQRISTIAKEKLNMRHSYEQP